MFQEFMGMIQEGYDNIDNFFDDLLTKESISGIIKTASKVVDTPSSKSSQSTKSTSPMFDFDDVRDKNISRLMDVVEQEKQDKRKVKSVDYNTIHDEWVQRLRGIAHKRPYFTQEAQDEQA